MSPKLNLPSVVSIIEFLFTLYFDRWHCPIDGYTDTTGVRSDFPLGTGGLIQLNNSHSHWTGSYDSSTELYI